MAQVGRALLLALVLLAPAAHAAVPGEALRAEGEGRWDDALAIYAEALKAAPADAGLWLRIADIHAARKDAVRAADALEHAAVLRPDDLALQRKASQAWAMANEPAPALAAARRATRIAPKDFAARRAVAELAVWNGDLALAQSEYAWLIDRDPADATLLKPYAQVLSRRGALDEAVGWYAAYVGKQPKDDAALLEYATAEMYRGDFAASALLLQDYERRFGRTPALEVAHAEQLARAGKPGQALARLSPMLAQDPDRYDVHLIHALALNSGRRPGDAEAAVGQLRRLGAARPETTGTALQVETSRRVQLGGVTEWYDDTAGLTTTRAGSWLALSPFAESRVIAAIDQWTVRAEAGSGYGTPAGEASVQVRGFEVGLEQTVTSWMGFRIAGGAQSTDGASAPRWLGAVEWHPADALAVRLTGQNELLRVSPRSAALGIERETTDLSARWTPGWSATTDLRLALEDYSDANEAREAVITQRFAVERSARLNVDLGVRAQWLGFERASAAGYYAPEDFRRYWGVAYGWWKLADDAGIGLSLGAGPERDAALDTGYEWGGDARLEAIAGVFGDWQLRGHAGYAGRFDGGEVAGAWRGSGVGLDLTRRF